MLKHALVIGGTGMLSDVTLWLTNSGFHVSVMGRNPDRMDQLINQASDPSSITPVFADYRNQEELRKKVQRIVEKNGAIQLLVAWIHSYAKNALPIIAEEVSRNNEEHWKLYHVLGSSTDLKKVIQNVSIPPGCFYRQIQLGFVIEHGRSRWLTHKEISEGVIECIQKDPPLHIVGTVEPWEMRP